MWQQQIMNYKPFNEIEEQDLRVISAYLSTFDDVLTRQNEIVHFTSSGFVVNEARTKALMVYHNIYQSWSWTGGHVDGETDFLTVAIREVEEETGVKATPITSNIFAIDVLPVVGHFKKGKYVTPHLHVNVSYLLEADELAVTRIAEEENSAVAWIPIHEIKAYCKERHMLPVYEKIVNKIAMLNNCVDH